MSCKQQTKSEDICRMSWFLIEMDEGLSRGDKANDKVIYGIIHSVDIVEGESTYMFINRKVRFKWNHAIREGKVIFASDDRIFIEQQLKTLAQNNEEAKLSLDLSKRFLIQYNKETNTIVHAIAHPKDIILPKENFEQSIVKEVLIRDDKIRKIATVLHINESDELMQKEFDVLKTRCFDGAFKDPHDNKDIKETPWLLVQYSKSPSSVSYSIVHINCTVLQTENLFPNIIAYLAEGDAIFQGIIMQKSYDRNELDKELRSIKESCLNAVFPLTTCVCDDNNANIPKQIVGAQMSISLQLTAANALTASQQPDVYENSLKILTLNHDELKVFKN